MTVKAAQYSAAESELDEEAERIPKPRSSRRQARHIPIRFIVSGHRARAPWCHNEEKKS